MAAKFTFFFALCAVVAVHADSDIQAQVTRWANEQQDWLNTEGVDVSQYVDTVIANPDVNENIKALLTSFIELAASAITGLNEKFAAIKVRAANSSSEVLQQLKEDIREIQDQITLTIETINERYNEVYAQIKKNKANPISEGNVEALDSIEVALRKRFQNDEVWRDRANGQGDDIASQITGEE